MTNETKLKNSTASTEQTKAIVTTQPTSFEPTKQQPQQNPENSTVTPGKVEHIQEGWKNWPKMFLKSLVLIFLTSYS